MRQLQPGLTLINRYAIIDVIGVGGMGSVYHARDLHFPNINKMVAIKEMINQTSDPLLRQMIIQNFEREAHLLATLTHPSIPKIFDYFTHDERSYLILEYVPGKDLEKIINETDEYLPAEKVAAWAVELCDVLQYLHDHKPEPIIFRDIKPSNIMINLQNHVVLVDFGIAKLFKSGQKGTMIGTEGYSPPEQYRGEATFETDIYALGATLHHTLTKRDPRLEPPFSFPERQIRKINPAVSSGLESVINRALQYSPQKRYLSAESMKMALLEIDNSVTPQIFDHLSPDGTAQSQGQQIVWKFNCEDEIRGTPLIDNGIIYIGSYDKNMYALHADSGQLLWKYSTEGGIVGKPTIHDNTLFFGSEDGRLFAVSSRTGKISWTFATDGPIRCSPVVAEGHVLVGSDDGKLYAVNILTNRKTWHVDAAGPIRSTPTISDGEILVGCESGDFYCINFRGEVKWNFKSKRPITSSPTAAKGVTFFASLDNMLYALDTKTGWISWRFRMGKGSISSPFIFDNYIYVGSADEYIYCLDSSNAKELWKFKTGHQVGGSPIVANGLVFCGSADKNLYCLEHRTGKLKWNFTTGSPITGSPAIYKDMVYFGSLDHTLYAIKA